MPNPPGVGSHTVVELISPERSPILVLVCDPSLRGTIEPQLAAWPAQQRLEAGVDGTVVILAHSDGERLTSGAVSEHGAVGGDLAEHLRRHRPFYEGMAGTRPEKPIDFSVMCGCDAGGFNEEVQLRDGFGYRPLHRVFTVPSCLDRTDLVVRAIIAIGGTAYDRAAPYRARYDTDPVVEAGRTFAVACYGVVDDDALVVQSGLHRLTLAHGILTESPGP